VKVCHPDHEAVLIDPKPGSAFLLVPSGEDPDTVVLSLHRPGMRRESGPIEKLVSITGHHDRVGRGYSLENDNRAHRPSLWELSGTSKKGDDRLL
jgi:hypothetical protein